MQLHNNKMPREPIKITKCTKQKTKDTNSNKSKSSSLKIKQFHTRENEFLADLIMLNMNDFDIILGMDGLASHHASIDYYEKTITFKIDGQPTFRRKRKAIKITRISAIKVEKLLRKGCGC